MLKTSFITNLRGPGDIRTGMTGGSVFASSKFRTLMTADHNDGSRNLRYSEHGLIATTGAIVRRNVESVSLFRDGAHLHCLGVDRVASGFAPFAGVKRIDGGTWRFNTLPDPGLPFEFGDINTSLGHRGIWKGNDWRGGYVRRWYTTDENDVVREMTGLDQGSNHEVYGISVFEPRAFEKPVRSKTKYVALVWSFDVSDEGDRDIRQHGIIKPVWAVSDDLIGWTYPFGHDASAVDMGDYKMIMPYSTPIRFGDKIAVHLSLANYEHSRWGTTPDRKLDVGLAEITVAEFEQLFAEAEEPVDPPPAPPTPPVDAFYTVRDGAMLIDPDAALAVPGVDRIAFTKPINVELVP